MSDVGLNVDDYLADTVARFRSIVHATREERSGDTVEIARRALSALVEEAPENLRELVFEHLIIEEVRVSMRIRQPELSDYTTAMPQYRDWLISYWPRVQSLLSTSDGNRQVGVLPDQMSTSDTLGLYRIVRRLGTGGFGTVFEATHDVTGTRVAIKVLHSWWAMDPERGEYRRRQFAQEAQTMLKFKHKHVVEVLSVCDSAEPPYIVQRFVDGGDLAQRIHPGQPLTEYDALNFALQIADALTHIHSKGVWHRDLKPSNILVDKNNQLYVADFGLVLDDSARYTAARTMAGTLPYMSPEQVRGETHLLNSKCDIWALGVILYEMLTGNRPFSGDETRLCDEILNWIPTSPRERHNYLHPEVSSLCERCLDKAPGERPTAIELKDALLDLIHRIGQAVPSPAAGSNRVPAPVESSVRFGSSKSLSADIPGWTQQTSQVHAELAGIANSVSRGGPSSLAEQLRSWLQVSVPRNRVQVVLFPTADKEAVLEFLVGLDDPLSPLAGGALSQVSTSTEAIATPRNWMEIGDVQSSCRNAVLHLACTDLRTNMSPLHSSVLECLGSYASLLAMIEVDDEPSWELCEVLGWMFHAGFAEQRVAHLSQTEAAKFAKSLGREIGKYTVTLDDHQLAFLRCIATALTRPADGLVEAWRLLIVLAQLAEQCWEISTLEEALPSFTGGMPGIGRAVRAEELSDTAIQVLQNGLRLLPQFASKEDRMLSTCETLHRLETMLNLPIRNWAQLLSSISQSFTLLHLADPKQAQPNLVPKPEPLQARPSRSHPAFSAEASVGNVIHQAKRKSLERSVQLHNQLVSHLDSGARVGPLQSICVTRVVVVGKAKRGKTSLVRALLGSGDPFWSPRDRALPTNAIVRYRSGPHHLEVSTATGLRQVMREELLKSLSPWLWLNQAINVQESLLKAKRCPVFHVTESFPLLPMHFELVDTPPYADFNGTFVESLKVAMESAHVAVAVISADSPLDRDELEMIRRVADQFPNALELVFTTYGLASNEAIRTRAKQVLRELLAFGLSFSISHLFQIKSVGTLECRSLTRQLLARWRQRTIVQAHVSETATFRDAAMRKYGMSLNAKIDLERAVNSLVRGCTLSIQEWS